MSLITEGSFAPDVLLAEIGGHHVHRDPVADPVVGADDMQWSRFYFYLADALMVRNFQLVNDLSALESHQRASGAGWFLAYCNR